MNITNYMKAGYGLLGLETFEVKRAMQSIKVDEPFEIYKWNMLDGLVGVQNGEQYVAFGKLFELMTSVQQKGFLLENANFFFESEEFVQLVLNYYRQAKLKQNTIIMVGSDMKFPSQIEKIATKLHFELPKKEEFRQIMSEMVQQIKDDENKIVEYNESCADACIGLSLEEGENALALSLVRTEGKFDRDIIIEMKREMFRSTGFMDYMEPQPIENIGGLENLKRYVLKRKEAWEKDSIKPKIKAFMLIGVPGGGKSLFTAVLSSIMNWPGIDLDVGSLKGGIVGETEKNWRLVTQIIDASGEAIIRVDEVEKMFAGGTSEIQTNSVDAGQLGYFLKWMQESKREAIIVVTANNIKQLPPEFLRAGRWDTIFFVDFPNAEERKEIVKIMNRKHKSNLPTDSDFIQKLEKWTGAEIEVLAKDSHFESVDEAMKNIPLVVNTKKDEIKELEKYRNMVRVANATEVVEIKQDGRKVTITKGKEEVLDAPLKKSILQQIREKREKEGKK